MDFFKGLNSSQQGLLRHSASYVDFPPDAVIFKEADPALGLYYIISGEVEIFKDTPAGEERLGVMKAGEVFGEMGLFTSNYMRTAGARSLTESTLYELPGNPVELLRRVGHPPSAAQLVQNLICILGERLRGKDTHNERHASRHKPIASYELTTAKALETIEKSLPSGLLRRFMLGRTYKPGEFLCRAGEMPDAFYFLHEGQVEVCKDPDGGEVLNTIEAPAVTGEVGFFTGQKRSASLRAATVTKCTCFSAAELERVKRDDPEQAFQLLFAAAQLTVALIVQKESL